jgi:hypothetical protein
MSLPFFSMKHAENSQKAIHSQCCSALLNKTTGKEGKVVLSLQPAKINEIHDPSTFRLM